MSLRRLKGDIAQAWIFCDCESLHMQADLFIIIDGER